MKKVLAFVIATAMMVTLAAVVAASTTQIKNVQFHCDIPGFSSPGQNRANNIVFTLVGGNWEFEAVCGCGEVVTSSFSNSSNALNGNNVQVNCPAVPVGNEVVEEEEIVEVWTVDSVDTAVGGLGLYKNAKGDANTLWIAYSVTVNFSSNLGNEGSQTFDFAPIAWNEYRMNGFGSAKNKAAVTDVIAISGEVELTFEALAGETVSFDFVSTVRMWLENRGHSQFDEIGERLTTATILFA
jgi:hypothetical protein